ncbi:cell division protein SepF [Lactiplantibacillus plantarum]|nr:cell division protein SepF [Lactiplantibacillus plantarum]
MAGFISNFFGVGDSDDQYEEPTQASQAAAPTEPATNTRSTPKVVPMQGGKSVNSKIALFEPKIYSDVKEIATQLLKNQAVIVNFDHVDDEMARRIVDFLTGRSLPSMARSNASATRFSFAFQKTTKCQEAQLVSLIPANYKE